MPRDADHLARTVGSFSLPVVRRDARYVPSEPPPPMPSADGAIDPGAPIGDRYVAIRPLGHGGMGTVWEVEHHALGRRFALKVLRDGRCAPEAVITRFRREARVAAMIDHPNVVHVFDYHVDPQTGPFLVMELLRGESLADAMTGRETMTLRETVEWLAPPAHALDALHAHGLVHRDVKPENIMRALPTPDSVIKLVDLGLAVHMDGRDRITRTGIVVGTPHYLAPELAEGDAATSASDVYALAVVAYELLTGTVPHDGETPMEIACNKLLTPAPALFERSGRRFSIAIEELFARALNRDAAARPASASAFVRGLAACIKT